jgi:hypothetical protein
VHEDDVRLIAALTQGDEAAIRAFSHSVQRPLVGLVRRLVGEDGVDDVVQNARQGRTQHFPMTCAKPTQSAQGRCPADQAQQPAQDIH